jgi:hypothetical protein
MHGSVDVTSLIKQFGEPLIFGIGTSIDPEIVAIEEDLCHFTEGLDIAFSLLRDFRIAFVSG